MELGDQSNDIPEELEQESKDKGRIAVVGHYATGLSSSLLAALASLPPRLRTDDKREYLNIVRDDSRKLQQRQHAQAKSYQKNLKRGR